MRAWSHAWPASENVIREMINGDNLNENYGYDCHPVPNRLRQHQQATAQAQVDTTLKQLANTQGQLDTAHVRLTQIEQVGATNQAALGVAHTERQAELHTRQQAGQSTRRAEQLYDALESRLPYACYCQGTASRNELLDCFRDDPDGAVLFATKSFWEGVDIPGEALSLVIIDKLPFAPHRDPVTQHREQRIREAGGSPFNEYMLPEAILALKQGVGRLTKWLTNQYPVPWGQILGN